MFQIIKLWLSGKKTYILGGLTIIGLVVQAIVGDLTPSEMIDQVYKILMGMGLLTLRAGVTKSGPGNGKTVDPKALVPRTEPQ